MTGDPEKDQAETRAIARLTDVIAECFKPGGALDGHGFALWIIPSQKDGGSPALISNTPRPRVAEVVGDWMLRNNFAVPVPVSAPDAKPN